MSAATRWPYALLALDLLVAVIVVAASLGVAAFGWVMDNSAGKRLRAELADIDAQDRERDESTRALQHDVASLQIRVTAWRHYATHW